MKFCLVIEFCDWFLSWNHSSVITKLLFVCLFVCMLSDVFPVYYYEVICLQTHARIQLQFTDVKGEKLLVTRLMQLTQKAKKLEFKTKDSTLSRMSHGEVGSITVDR